VHITVVTKLFPTSFDPYYGIFTKRFFDKFCSKYPEENVNVIRGVPFPANMIFRSSGKVKISFQKNFINAGGYNIHYPVMVGLGPLLLRHHYRPYYKMLEAFFRKNNIVTDILHAYWLYPDGYVATKLGNKLNKPVIVHCLGDDVNEQINFPELEDVHRYTLENCNAIIVCSNEMKVKLSNKYPAMEGKIHLIYNGVDREYYYNTDYEESIRKTGIQKEEGKYIILFAGKICREKGVRELLSAVLQLKEKRNDFIVYIIGVYGSKEEVSEFKRFIKYNNIAHYVKIIGSVPEVKYWYRMADYYILPTYSEGLPLTLLEALATGIPAISTAVGGIPEVINKPIIGKLIQPKDSNALVEALEEMMNTKFERKAVSESILEFDLKVQTERMYQLYKELITKN
jgi:teichuronic acid biosynthesis glycosyltransferase TuaC